MSNKTPAMILQELSIKIAAASPEYTLIHQVQGKHENEFIYQVSVLGTTATGKGRSKKEAKQETARNVLAKLKELKMYESNEGLPAHMDTATMEDVELKQVINYIGMLGDLCLYYSLPPPEYPKISEAGPSHAMEFTYECHVGSLITRATASSKKQVRQTVAREMLERLADVVPQIKSAHETNLLQLCDKEAEVIEMYNDLSVLSKLNLGLQIQDYNKNLRHVMEEKGINYEDIKMYLDDMNEFKLASLLEKFEMNYTFENITQEDEDFITVVLNITADIPLCTMGQATDFNVAKDMALARMYDLLITLLKLKNVDE